jgi:hypothetical protein
VSVGFALELLKNGAVLNHQVGKKFQRDLAREFFIRASQTIPIPPRPRILISV